MIFDNPVFKREFGGTLRSPKMNFIAAAYLLMLGGAMLLLWPSGGIQSMVSESSRQIFALFFNVNLTLLMLLVPAYSAPSVTYERENNTYAALFSTLLSPFEIMAGKLLASIGILLIIVILSMPIASICALTGGVDVLFMCKAMTLLIAAAISYGMLALACSSICFRTIQAIMATYVCIMVLSGASWLPDALLSNLLPDFNNIWQIIRNLSPYDALFYLLYPDNYRLSMSSALPSFLNPFNNFLIFSTILSAASLAVFSAHIRKVEKGGKTQSAELYDDVKTAVKRKLSWPFYLFDPLKRKKQIGRFSNPVFVAEMRNKLFANPKFVMRTISALFITSLVLLTLISLQFGVSLRADTIRMAAIIFQTGVIAMLAPGISSGLITDEINSGTFNHLRMTPLSAFTVIAGKLKATFFYGLIFIASSALIIFAMAYLEQQNLFPEGSLTDPAWWQKFTPSLSSPEWWANVWKTYWRLAAWVGILLAATLTFLSAGLCASAFSKKTSEATATAYAFAAVLCVVTLAPHVLGSRISPDLAYLILSFNPLAAAMQITCDTMFTEYQNLWKADIIAMLLMTAILTGAATIRTWYLFRKAD